jgi:hypothetical protein
MVRIRVRVSMLFRTFTITIEHREYQSHIQSIEKYHENEEKEKLKNFFDQNILKKSFDIGKQKRSINCRGLFFISHLTIFP